MLCYQLKTATDAKADIASVNECLAAKANKASVANALHRKVRAFLHCAIYLPHAGLTIIACGGDTLPTRRCCQLDKVQSLLHDCQDALATSRQLHEHLGRWQASHCWWS